MNQIEKSLEEFYKKISEINKQSLKWCPNGCGKKLEHFDFHHQYNRRGERVGIIAIFKCLSCQNHFNKIELVMENLESDVIL